MRVLSHAVFRFGGPIPSVNLTMIAYPGKLAFEPAANTPATPVCAIFPGPSIQPGQGLFFGGNLKFARDSLSASRS